MVPNSPRSNTARDGTLRFLMFALLLLAWPRAAAAAEFGVLIQPGAAVPLTAPQSELFEAGGGESLKAPVRGVPRPLYPLYDGVAQ